MLRGGDGDDAQRAALRLAEQRLHRRVEAAHLLAVEHRRWLKKSRTALKPPSAICFMYTSSGGRAAPEAARQVRRALAAPPHALEVERRADSRELAVGALEVDEVRWRGLWWERWARRGWVRWLREASAPACASSTRAPAAEEWQPAAHVRRGPL